MYIGMGMGMDMRMGVRMGMKFMKMGSSGSCEIFYWETNGWGWDLKCDWGDEL